MKGPYRKRKCPHCKEFFTPDPYNHYHQRFCSKPPCQKARKAAQQKAWAQRPDNRDHWRGADEVARVQAWRRAHPGYWKKRRPTASPALQAVSSAQSPGAQPVKPEPVSRTLQVVSPLQPPWVLGLISLVTGSTLQADILATHRRLVERGQEILGMVPGTPTKNYDAQTTPGPGALAPTPAPV